ncbi:MAG: hypothetical protein QG577_631 [Thermodesulfobacteriota bacterium]|nr:hypothetical protein [Thermodesulfobacteriota bacterium]
MEQTKEIRREMTTIIRGKSRDGQLIQREELLEELVKQSLLKSEDIHQGSQFESALQQVVMENKDIIQLSGRNGICNYYSSLSLSETYAGILVRKEEDSLIAEIVRENSIIYPRPVPVNMFTQPPFELTEKEISDCLEKMGKHGDYQDIAEATTSAGTVFLYSNKYLDPIHAAMLAEWIDVGGVNNP